MLLIEPAWLQDTIIELIHHCFSPLRIEPLIQPVPMRRLIYPAGFEYLPRVREAVLADVGENHGGH